MTQDYAYVDAEASGGALMQGEPLSVSAAMELAKLALEHITVSIIGEISDLSDNPRYKAVYFTLADQGAALPCLMWRSSFDRLGVQLKNGMQVEVRGRFSLYSAKGRMQFDVRELTLAGEGRLRAQVAQLAMRLKAQGFMDESRKLPLPIMPERIALITSPRGKAVHDVLRTLRRRFPIAEVLLFGVGVEGRGAPAGIIQALKMAELSSAEVILLVRGGGSYEDLMPFNDESLAVTLATLQKPVITGIGHEPDTSLADMVASFRASTPTAAAEAAAPDMQELLAWLYTREGALGAGFHRYLDRGRFHVEILGRSQVFVQERFLTARLALGLEQTAERLDRAIPTGLFTAQTRAREAGLRLQSFRAKLIGERVTVLHRIQQAILLRGASLTHGYEKALVQAAASMESLSPLAVLSRGYALGYDRELNLLRSVAQVTVGEQIRVRLADGMLKAQVVSKEEGTDT